MKQKGLGRGLDAIFGTAAPEARLAPMSEMTEIAVEDILPNPAQPRTSFDEEALDELADSIRQLGLIQPITVRRNGDGRYTIISGERRWRAAQRADLRHLPAYIREADDENLHAMALVENIQREDLNAIEIALTFKKLIDQYNLTQERLSERVGKKRATVANFLRLLRLPAEVQLGLRDKRVDMGHARALLSLDNPHDQLRIYKLILKEGLSVRRVEELVKEARENTAEAADSRPQKKQAQSSHDFDLLKKHLSTVFATPVNFSCDRSGKGRISFQFANEEELARLITLFDTLQSQ